MLSSATSAGRRDAAKTRSGYRGSQCVSPYAAPGRTVCLGRCVSDRVQRRTLAAPVLARRSGCLDWNRQTEDFVGRSTVHNGEAGYYAIFRNAMAARPKPGERP